MPEPSEGRDVLFIDDDGDFAGAISRVLRHSGYSVRCAGNGEEGVRMAAEKAPDIVLLDFMMPGMNGFQACRALREEPGLEGVPIIALTAFGQNIGEIHGLRQEEAEAHICAFLEKPVEPNVLLDRMSHALSAHAK